MANSVGSTGATGIGLGGANFALGLDSTQLEQGLANVKAAVEQQTQTVQQQLGQQQSVFTQAHSAIRGALDSTGISVGELSRGLNDLSQIVLGFTVANTFGGIWRQIGEEMAQASEASRNLGEEITKLEAITGASADQASQAIAVWGRFGLSAGDVEHSFTTLSRAITDFNTGVGNKAGGQALDDLGIALKDVQGNALPLTTVLPEIFDALGKITDPATRDTDAIALLGRSYQDLAVLIKEGSAGLAELAAGMGSELAMTDAQRAEQEKWRLSITGMDAAFKGLSLTLGDVLAGPMTRLADDVKSLVKGWDDNKSGVQGWKDALETLVTGLEDVGGGITAVLGPIGQFLTSVEKATSDTGAFFSMLKNNQNMGSTPFAGLTPPSTTAFGNYTTPGYVPPPGSAAPVPVGYAGASGQYNLGQGGQVQRGIPVGSAGNMFDFGVGFPTDSTYSGGGGGPAGGYSANAYKVTPGLPTAGQAGFTWNAQSTAAGGSGAGVPAPRDSTPPSFQVGAPADQYANADTYQQTIGASVKRGDLGAAAGKTAIDAQFTAQKDADAALVKQGADYSTEMERQATETSKFQIGLLDDQLAAAKYAETQLTAANDATHKAAIDGITAEKTASDAYYKGATEAATAQRDLATRAAGTTHDDALAQIAADTKTAADSFALQKTALDLDKAGAIQANQQKHDAAIASVQDEVQKEKDARQVAALSLQETELAENQRNAKTHQDNLDAIHTEGQAKLDTIAAAEKADQAAAAASLRTISDATAEYNAQHQDRLRALQDEARAESQQHQGNLDAITAETKTATDQHTADLKAITDQTTLLDAQHTKALQAITDQATAEAAAQAAQLEAIAVATKAQQDALTATTKAQTDAIDEQITAITAAANAATAAKLDAQQSQTLSTDQANLGQDTRTGAAPSKIIADAQAVDAAQAAIEATAAQRKEAQQLADLTAQKTAVAAADALQKQSIADQAAAQQAAIADQAARDLALRNTQIRDLNDQLTAAKAALAQETAAENAAFQTRITELQAETDAENKRFAGDQAKLQSETEAENVAAQAFAASQAKKTQAVQDALKVQTDANAVATAAETKSIAGSVTSETARYTAETASITTTRKLAADKLALEQTQTDETFVAQTLAANVAYTAEQKNISDTYDKPVTGLFAQLATAEKTSHDTLATRTIDANVAYKAEQDRIKQTYDGPREDGGLALLPSIAKAHDDASTAFALRKTDADTAYNAEKEQIRLTYLNDDPSHLGIIPAIDKAKKDNTAALLQQVSDWKQWESDTKGTIDGVIAKLKELHDAQANANKPPTATAAAAASSGGGGGGAGVGASGGAAGGAGRGRYGDPPLTQAQWGSGLESQYGVDTRDAACGPLALEGLLQIGGMDTNLGSVISEAAQKGWWNTAVGMTSADNFSKMADAFGMPVANVSNAAALADLESGIPVVLNTPNHYFLAQGYDPNTQLFDMGNTGLSVFNQRYMTLAQAQGFGGGSVRDFFAPTNSGAVTGAASGSGDGLLWDGVSLTGPAPAPGTTGAAGAAGAPIGPEVGGVYHTAAQADAIAAGFPADVFLRQIQQESGFNPDGPASSAGAIGIAQFEPGTAAGLHVDPHDPYASLLAAAKYDEYLSKTYGGVRNALWAYNAGEGNFQAGIMPAETRGYLDIILGGLPGYGDGGVIDRPSLLVDKATWEPYAQVGERGIEHVVPQGAGAPAVAANYHFDLTGASTDQMAVSLQRQFERNRWLHQGWR